MSRKQKKTSRYTPSAVQSMVQASASRPVITNEFKPDYSYIIKDLKRIGILVAIFVTILVVLSFIIH